MVNEKLIKKFFLDPATIKAQAILVSEKFKNKPEFACSYLSNLLEVNDLTGSSDPDVAAVLGIIESLRRNINGDNDASEKNGLKSGLLDTAETDKALKEASKEIYFRKRIEEFYLPKQLVAAIIENGEIPDKSEESLIGIGFLDIADYTYLSKFLTPMENQIVLNGLYAAFSWVLQRHNGYLNKIEGDSLMFHFGGNIDPKVKNMSDTEAKIYISRELFYTCIEMQRVAFQFNEANDSFLYGNKSDDIRDQISRAFTIISAMRNSELSQSINAFFQIRIRIGANIGEVTMGNFGPEGSKQWDIIGNPVIKAKRMESTAPVGGFRISDDLYNVLLENGVLDEYYNRFRREAQILSGSFHEITFDELYRRSKVTIKEKRGAEFITYSIQVNPGLPEAIMRQVDLLLNRGEDGADRINSLLQYYRGNKFVINKIENAFSERNINIRKGDLYNIIFPGKYKRLLEKNKGNKEKLDEELENKYSLFNIFDMLGSMQDTIKCDLEMEEKPHVSFNDYEGYMNRLKKWIIQSNSLREKRVYQRNYFYNYIFPMIFLSIRTSIIEYQQISIELSEI